MIVTYLVIVSGICPEDITAPQSSRNSPQLDGLIQLCRVTIPWLVWKNLNWIECGNSWTYLCPWCPTGRPLRINSSINQSVGNNRTGKLAWYDYYCLQLSEHRHCEAVSWWHEGRGKAVISKSKQAAASPKCHETGQCLLNKFSRSWQAKDPCYWIYLPTHEVLCKLYPIPSQSFDHWFIKFQPPYIVLFNGCLLHA